MKSLKMTHEARFLCAAAHGNEAEVRAMLAKRVAVDVRDGKGRTALMLAADVGCCEIVRLLLDSGADATARNNGNRPVIDYVQHPAVARAILGAMPMLERATAATRLLFQYGVSVQCLQVALEYGAQVNARNRRGDTALHVHAYSGSAACVQFLLAAGALPDEKNCHGKTPLLIAIWLAYADVAQLLVDAGADVYTCDAKGRTLEYLTRCNCAACKECIAVLDRVRMTSR